jgi:type IV pilus assembly protein PilW
MTRRNKQMRLKRVAHQRGVSLVEIMVAMVIGLFMLAALLTVFLNMRSTVRDQDSLAGLQDNERLALTVLTDTAQQAGYFPNPLANTSVSSLPALSSTYATLAAGQSVSGTTGSNGTSDTLAIRYVTGGNDGVLNCLGQSSPALATYVNVFAVSASNELTCTVNGDAQNSAVLATGVSAINVLYGTDINNDGNVDQYLTATAVTAGGYWSQVNTLQITIAFINPYAGQPGQPAGINWTQTISLMNRT